MQLSVALVSSYVASFTIYGGWAQENLNQLLFETHTELKKKKKVPPDSNLLWFTSAQ